MASPDALSRYVAGAPTSEDHSAEIKESHIQTGQKSWKAPYESIKRTRLFPNMRQDICCIVRSCPACIHYNIVTTKIGSSSLQFKQLESIECCGLTTEVLLACRQVASNTV
jgi:Integrase zinc binding domain